MRTMVAVAPEPKPSQQEDVLAFLDLVISGQSGEQFIKLYFDYKSEGWRLGQTFMKVLPFEYYDILAGSLVDPFYKDDWDSVCKALDYLLERI